MHVANEKTIIIIKRVCVCVSLWGDGGGGGQGGGGLEKKKRLSKMSSGNNICRFLCLYVLRFLCTIMSV